MDQVYDTNKYNTYCCAVCKSTNILINVDTTKNDVGNCLDCAKRKYDIVGSVISKQFVPESKNYKRSELEVKFNELSKAIANPKVFAQSKQNKISGEPFNESQEWFFTAEILVYCPDSKTFGVPVKLFKVEDEEAVLA